jgi:putative hemolysin
MIPLVLFLLGCLAVFVGTVEAAFSSLMRLSLRLMAERNGRHDALGKYLDDPMLLFVPARLLLGMIFALATVLLAVQIGTADLQAGLLLLLSIVLFILVTEHLVPLLIVRRDPERVLEVLLPSFEVLTSLVRPVGAGVVRLVRAGRGPQNGASPGPDPDADRREESAPAPDRAPAEGRLAEGDERRLLRSIVEFGETLVREVMTPRPDIVAIRADATLDELRAHFREQEYSRIPVFRDDLDDILGFVFVKDLIQLQEVPGDERPIASLVRPAHVVPETKRVAELLKEFQVRQVQIAIVVDEYGGTAGLVTLEDLLEEIVGEIRDEYDIETEPIVEEPDGTFVVSGKVDIDEVAERLGVVIEREGFETVGGYLLSHLGRVPAPGEAFEIDDLEVSVLEAERRRVHRVRLRRRSTVLSPES